MSQTSAPLFSADHQQLDELRQQTIEIEAQKLAKQRARTEKEKEKQRQLKQRQRSQIITIALLIGTILISLLLQAIRTQ